MSVIPPSTSLDAAARERIDALITLFQGAVSELEGIAVLMEKASDRRFIQRRIREAKGIIDDLMTVHDGALTGPVAAWAREHFPATYSMGAGLAVADLRAQGVAVLAGEARIHTRAVDALLNRYLSDTTELVVQMNLSLVRTSRIVLAQAGFSDQIAAGIIGGLPRKETSRLLKSAMQRAINDALPAGTRWSPASLAQVEINGRVIRIDAWAEMHARTETARASTAGTRVLSVVNGVGHVQITTHSHAPCICTPYEGRIYSLREGDPQFAWIGDVPNGGCPMHPNCAHREAPAVVEYLAERNDIAGRTRIPPDFEGLDEAELARLIRTHKSELERYSRDRTGMMPEDFRLPLARAA